MRSVLLLCLFLLHPATVWSFRAEVQTSTERPSGPQSVTWTITGDDGSMCLAVKGMDACLGQVSRLPQGWIITISGQHRELQGEVLFDENAEAPWNLLPIFAEGRMDISVRVMAQGVDLTRGYVVVSEALPPSDLAVYDIEPLAGKDYHRVRVYRGESSLAEQIWVAGERFWLIDISSHHRSVRVRYEE